MEWYALDDPAFWLATGSVVLIMGGVWLWSWLWRSPYETDLDPMSKHWRMHQDRHRDD
jgi:hypothetical protein